MNNQNQLTNNNSPDGNTSGQGFRAPVPKEIKGWNWGAAILTWIWGIRHKVWLSLLVFVPYVGLIMSLILGYKGNEWAWQSQYYNSIAEFKEREKKWTKISLIIFVISIVLLIIFSVIIFLHTGRYLLELKSVL